MTQQPKKFAASMKQYFGILPGTSVSQFSAELKALSDEERIEFAKMLNAAGYPTEMPAGTDEAAA